MKNVTALAFLLCCAPAAHADTFGSGANTFDIEFVRIGNPGNVADTTGTPNPAGSVPHSYRMATYEVSEQMIDKANLLGGLAITKDNRGPNKPATNVDWFEAAKFVNWLNANSGHPEAYKFPGGFGRSFALWQPGEDGYDPENRYRNRNSKYFLPSMDEWYKAAFYDPTQEIYFNYATGSNLPPQRGSNVVAPFTAVYLDQPGPSDVNFAGGFSPYGTMAQSGNVLEWIETENDFTNDEPLAPRHRRGGFFQSQANNISSSEQLVTNFPDTPQALVGFRVASAIPEPSTLLLVAMAGFGLLLPRRTRNG